MAGRDDEDDDETLIADLRVDDESTDDGQTLVAALPPLAPQARVSPRGPLPPPAAGAPPRTAPPPQAFGPRPTGTIPMQPRRAPPDDSLDRRALPFAVGTREPITTRPPPADFHPVTRTQELPNVSGGVAPPQPQHVPRSAPAAAPLAAPTRTAPPPAVAPAAPPVAQPSPAPPLEDSVLLPPSDATPPFVMRFLLVCGVLTALGLMALIYLEL
jgi:hypothetical protein